MELKAFTQFPAFMLVFISIYAQRLTSLLWL